jgi:hypothetical protein
MSAPQLNACLRQAIMDWQRCHLSLSHRPYRIMLKRSLITVCFLAACLSIFLATGCDLSGEYDKKVQSSLQESAKKAVFEENLHTAYTDVTDAARKPVGVRLRLPKIFDANSKVVTQGISPAMAKLPGAYTLMRELDDPSGQKSNYVVSMFAVPKAVAKGKDAGDDFAKGFASAFPGAKWEDVSFRTPTDESITIKRLRADTSQAPVFAEAASKAGKASPNIRFDIFNIDAGDKSVIIWWMMPKSLATTLDPAIDASMGTVQVTGGNSAAPGGKAAAGCF